MARPRKQGDPEAGFSVLTMRVPTSTLAAIDAVGDALNADAARTVDPLHAVALAGVYSRAHTARLLLDVALNAVNRDGLDGLRGLLSFNFHGDTPEGKARHEEAKAAAWKRAMEDLAAGRDPSVRRDGPIARPSLIGALVKAQANRVGGFDKLVELAGGSVDNLRELLKQDGGVDKLKAIIDAAPASPDTAEVSPPKRAQASTPKPPPPERRNVETRPVVGGWSREGHTGRNWWHRVTEISGGVARLACGKAPAPSAAQLVETRTTTPGDGEGRVCPKCRATAPADTDTRQVSLLTE